MTKPLYLADSSVRRFEATVERVLDDGRVVLDRTHFYPEGGGQPADGGWIRLLDGHVDDEATDEHVVDGTGDDHIDGATTRVATDSAPEWRVMDVQKRDRIHHHLEPSNEKPESPVPEPSAALEPGDTVVGRLDWDRRHAHMRYHTAQHLLSAHLLETDDAPTSGNQLYADRARLDCEHDRFDPADLESIEGAMNGYVEADLDVRWYELERERAEAKLDLERTRIDLLPDSISRIRIVEIGDSADPLDRVACAGTHVESTGEIGRVEITGRETAGSGRERIRFRLLE